MSKIYLIVPFENKDDAKSLGAKFDWDKKLWYANNTNKNKLLEKYKEYKSFDNIIGENREFNGSILFIDLIPTTSWFNNVRSCIYNEDWLRIRKYIYERVNYKCECCGLYCKNRIEYDDEDLDKNSDEEINDYLLELKSNKINELSCEINEAKGVIEKMSLQVGALREDLGKSKECTSQASKLLEEEIVNSAAEIRQAERRGRDEVVGNLRSLLESDMQGLGHQVEKLPDSVHHVKMFWGIFSKKVQTFLRDHQG